MFENLKKKLSGWFSSTKEKAKESEEETAVKEETELKPEKVEAKKVEKKPEKKEELKAEVKIKEKPKPEIKKEQEYPEETQAEEPGEIKPKKSFFQKIFHKTYTITQEYIEEIFPDLEMLLIENNVALSVVDKIKKELEKDLVGITIDKKELEEEVKKTLKKIVSNLLLEPFDLIKGINEKQGTFTILFFGINGSGKTTTIAKLAYLLKKNEISCILTASDTFRAASIEQLQKHGENLGIKVIKHNYGADPSAVAFDAIQHAKAHKIKVVLIDTAGRMHTKENLMKEMEKIVRVTKPNLKIFIGESITGNDAVNQAQIFNETAGIDAVILSKADVDEKAGTVLSVSKVTGKPIIYLGMGQNYSDLEFFDKKKVLERLGF